MALSDPAGILASPLTIINCKDDIADVAAITDIISQQQVKQIIVNGLANIPKGSLRATPIRLSPISSPKLRVLFTSRLYQALHQPKRLIYFIFVLTTGLG